MIWSLWFDSEGKWFNRSTCQLALISMNQPMNDAPLCRQCGKQLPIEFKGVGCPACLLLGMRLQDGDDETIVLSGGGGGRRADSENVSSLIGPYELFEPLGEGGFGIVHRARQQKPIRREVALKLIKPGMGSQDVLARFEAERQALALMDHPNIASVLDAGTTKLGQPYFVMELVRGVSITDYCDAHRLGIRERLELFIPVCQAVQHAHQKSILHRDLKPANILVTEVDGKPIPKVIDFGIAKALRTESDEINLSMTLTRGGMVVGTPQYMSPEQAGSVADVDTRSDVYALGIILHELLIGQPPLSKEQLRKAGMNEILHLIREAETKRPSSGVASVTEAVDRVATARNIDAKRLCAALQGDLDWIILKALEKDRERRYATANALVHDLQCSLQDQPVSAGPPTFRYRVSKFMRRQKRALAISAVISVCLICGLVFGGVSLFAEREALAVAAERGREAKLALEQNRRTFSTSLFLQAHERWKN
jgi:serine/threonine protein kinase